MTTHELPRPVHLLNKSYESLPADVVRAKFVQATKAFGDLLSPTFGPNGQRKLLWSKNGEMSLTRDGAKIAAELLVRHPAAKQLVDLANSQESMYGDGVTRSILLASSLMAEASHLLGKGIHPLRIIETYDLCLKRTVSHLIFLSELTHPSSNTTKSLIRASLGGMEETSSELMIEILHTMFESLLPSDKKLTDRIWITKSRRGSLADTSVINGTIVEKRRFSKVGPTKFTSPRLLLIRQDIDINKSTRKMEIEVEDSETFHAMIDKQSEIIQGLVDQIDAMEIDIILSGGSVNPSFLHRLAQKGCLVISDIDLSDLERVAQATDAKIADRIGVVEPEDIGFALSFELDSRNQKDEWIERWIIEGKNSDIACLDIGGQGEVAIEENIRMIFDSLKVLESSQDDNRVLPGGGASFASVGSMLRLYSTTIEKEQREIVIAFANAIESIPAVLINNAGRNVLEGLLDLRRAHQNGKNITGIDYNGIVAEMNNVNDLFVVENGAITQAVDCICSLLRVDQYIGRKGSA